MEIRKATSNCGGRQCAAVSMSNYLDILVKYLLWRVGGLSFGSNHPILLPSLKGIHEIITWLSTQNSLALGEVGRKESHILFCTAASPPHGWYVLQLSLPSYICQKHWILLTCEYSASPFHLSLLDHLCHFSLAPDQQSHWPSGFSSNRWSAFQSCSGTLAISPDRCGLPQTLHGLLLHFQMRVAFPDPKSITLALLTWFFSPGFTLISFTACFLCFPLLEDQLHEARNLGCFVHCSSSSTKNSAQNTYNYWMVE